MGRSISVDGAPKWLLQYFVAGLVVLASLWGFVVVLGVLVPAVDVFGRLVLLGMLALLWVALTTSWVRRADRRESSGSMWDATPRRQYAGRFAESGRLARESCERALPGDDDE